MTDDECVAPGCNRPYIARGLCTMHYQRWKAHGEPAPSAEVRRRDAPAHPLLRFVEKVTFTGSCWTWAASKVGSGYGAFHNDNGTQAHRWAYEFWNGPIPEGWQVDHLCRVRDCVNPDHLEAVTPLENIARATAVRTHCPQGHPYSGDNLYINSNDRSRGCRTCRRDNQRIYAARKKAS